MIKIAFLFLTITNIYHESHWLDFFKNHEQKYSIYIHSAKGVSSQSSFKSYELPFTVPTSWEHSMEAEVALLKEALKDSENQKFIFVSETTIPLRNFDTVFSDVMKTDKSIFNFNINPHQNPENSCYEQRNLNIIPEKHRLKNSQWVILNCRHAQLMIEDNIYLNQIISYEADNELYPATFLSLQEELNEVEPIDKTYVNWERRNPESMPRPYPYIFTNLEDKEEISCLVNAIKSGFLFARKFAENTDLTLLDQYFEYRN